MTARCPLARPLTRPLAGRQAPVALATATLAIALLLGGCARLSDRVVLLPSADGKPSAVVVTTREGRTQRLDQPYATVDVKGNALQPGSTTAEAVAKAYPLLDAALPARPQKFTVRFAGTGTQLTPESLAELETIKQALAKLPAAEIIVIGHTDAQGSNEANDRLSLQRAEAVREILVTGGFQREQISVVGRGKRELEVPTADGVAEPRNRRVEIKLR